jgi:DNA modification methylase
MAQHIILAGDCRALEPREVPENAVMITDPPYSDHVHDSMTSCAQHGARKGVRQRDAGFGSLSPELRAHVAALGARCRWSVVFSDWEGLSAWREAFNAQPNYRYVRVVPWIRWSMPQMSKDRPPQGSEAIIIAGHTKPMRWSGPGNLTHFDEACERGDEKHPTAKPLDLMCRLVQYFSEPGELILDPCCGRGTTILAAKLLGRDGLGIDDEQLPGEAGRARARVDAGKDLNDRDLTRWQRYLDGVAAEEKDGERRAATNAAVIARRKAKVT